VSVKIGKCGFPQIKFYITGKMFTFLNFRINRILPKLRITGKIGKLSKFGIPDGVTLSNVHAIIRNPRFIPKRSPQSQ